jgi:hypothetical protein
MSRFHTLDAGKSAHGPTVGGGVGGGVGAAVGAAVGLGVGLAVGAAVGVGVGDGAEDAVGVGVGFAVGDAVVVGVVTATSWVGAGDGVRVPGVEFGDRVAVEPPAPANEPAATISTSVRASRTLIPTSHRPNPFGIGPSVAIACARVNGSIVRVGRDRWTGAFCSSAFCSSAFCSTGRGN